MIEAILFDLDGVLVDSAPVHHAAWAALFAPFGIDFTPARYRAEASGRSRGDVIRAILGPRPDHDALMAKKAALVEAHLTAHGCPVVPGAPTLLEAVARRGLPMAVATASRMPEPFLRAAGLAGRFEVVVDRTQIARGKPAPDVYLEAARRLGVAPDRCLAIEDSPPGLAAARAAGCRTVGLTSNHPRQALHADGILDHLDEVIPLLDRAA